MVIALETGTSQPHGILMDIKDLRQDTLVEHPELGVGKIAGVEPEQNQAVISFRSEREFRMPIKDALALLETRPPAGLSAYLYTDPDEVLSWVNAGQLRLVGATLVDLGGTGRKKDLQDRLEKPVLSLVSEEWDPWWTKVQKNLKGSEYFEFQKPSTYRLGEDVLVEHIQVEPLALEAKAKKTAPTRKVSEGSRRDAHAAELKQLRESHAADLEKQRDAHAAELTRQREDRAAVLKQQREDHTSESIRQRDAHAAALKQQRDAHTDELRKLRESHVADLKQQRGTHAADLAQQRESHAADLAQQRESHAADLNRWKQEEERLYNRIENLAAKREESHLEIRRDMLDAMAATLKMLRQQQGDPASLLRDVGAGLKLALQAGEAQFYGQANQPVEYSPELHEAAEHIARGETVTIVHPGVLIPGIKTGNYILLKAQVKR